MRNNTFDLITYSGAYWKGKLYCLARDCNLLFSVDLQNGKTKLIDAVPEEDVLTNYICGAMAVWNGKLIFTPYKTKKIWIYDLVSKQWDSLALKKCEHCHRSQTIRQIYIYDNKIFLIGGGYPAILCLDLENNSCNYIEEPYKDIIARHPNPDYIYFDHYGIQLESTLYLASCLDNYVLKFHMDTLSYHWVRVGDDSTVHTSMTWDGSNFWLFPRLGDNLIKWDGKEAITKFPLPSELTHHPEYVWGACYDGEQIVFPATNHTNTILIDPKNGTLQIQNQQYTMYTQLDNGMVISQTTEGELLVKTGDSVQTYKITIDTDQLRQFYEDKNLAIFKKQTLYNETSKNSILSLENFLVLTKAASQNETTSDGQIGKTIWENIR